MGHTSTKRLDPLAQVFLQTQHICGFVVVIKTTELLESKHRDEKKQDENRRDVLGNKKSRKGIGMQLNYKKVKDCTGKHGVHKRPKKKSHKKDQVLETF